MRHGRLNWRILSTIPTGQPLCPALIIGMSQLQCITVLMGPEDINGKADRGGCSALATLLAIRELDQEESVCDKS